MSGVLGWDLDRSMYEAGGLLAPWILHFMQDVVIFATTALMGTFICWLPQQIVTAAGVPALAEKSRAGRWEKWGVEQVFGMFLQSCRSRS